MPYYKDIENKLHVIEPEFAHLLPAGSVPITDAEAEEIRKSIISKIIVPSSVTMRQARLALFAVGKLAQVEAAINSLPEPQKSEAKIEWEYSGEVLRDKPFVKSLGNALGLNDNDLDALFIEAVKL